MPTQQIQLDDSQQRALDLMSTEPICIVTGGPGTGKTTILCTLLDRLTGLDPDRVGLCAPTGKAAKRMFEATGREAKTIHRLCGYSPTETFVYSQSVYDEKLDVGVYTQISTPFFHNPANRLDLDLIVVDESSMIDIELLAHLVLAIEPERTRLVLVGDANQLPSVGPGAILGDLLDEVPTARLDTVHRSKLGSWICTNAPRILDGQSIDLEQKDDFRFLEAEDASDVPRICGDVYKKDQPQILIPQRTGAAGVDAVNAYMQDRFNPLQPGEICWGKAPHELRPRDRVIHTKNNYDLDVFNGEVGTVVSVTHEDLEVKYPDRAYPVVYKKLDATDLQLAYALTIHKSQGSEWPWVCVVIHSTHTFMLTRQLLYTGITRGKVGVVVVGNRKGVAAAIKCKKDSRRNTALGDRIRGEL